MRYKYSCVAVLLLSGTVAAAADIEWRSWGDDAFAEAERRDRPVYLYLEAVWCHWCHVMQRETLSDPEVVARLNKDFVAVRVDHDAQPALANRYRAWGWPAQIWFTPDGDEIAKRSGYMPPSKFGELLTGIADEPQSSHAKTDRSRAARAAEDTPLSEPLREELRAMHRNAHDPEVGGLRLMKKFLDADSVEYAMWRGRQGDAPASRRARRTLDAARQLIDPVWGGAYQYSVHGNWSNPHYEKLMRGQARYLRIYALAYLQYGDPDYQAAAFAVRDYLADFLQSPGGGFYTSQNADLVSGRKAHDYFALDDAARRERGMPSIDKSRYTNANGLAIEGLAMLHAATGDTKSLSMARRAAEWVRHNRGLESGGFAHGADAAQPYLADNLAMARAFLEPHRTTGERVWLERARRTADFVAECFRRDPAGFNGAARSAGPLAPVPDLDQNKRAVRLFNLLHHYTGLPRYRALAEHGMRYLTVPERATSGMDQSGILLADRELGRPPLHVTVVGGKDDAEAARLYRAALEVPGWYKRVEWWDRSQGPLPHADVAYPDLGRPAAYYCESQRCSLPQFTASDLRALVASRRDGA